MAKVLLVLLSVACLASGAPGSLSWNSLFRHENLFPEHLDSFAVSSSLEDSNANVVAQLKSLLETPAIFRQVYQTYKTAFGKGERSEGAQTAFFNSLVRIAEHNSRFDAGLETWDMGLNQFTDMEKFEIRQFYGGLRPSNETLPSQPEPKLHRYSSSIPNGGAPDKFDWRNYQGVVSPVKMQGGCGSCTIFAATSNLESAMALYKSTGNLDLSEQQTLDCNTSGGGCNGNSWSSILDYLKNGVVSEADYPYQAKKQNCAKRGDVKGTLSKWWKTSADEKVYKDWLATYGPMGISFLVSDDFHKYRGGLFDGACGTRNDGHAMTAVGYDNENGVDTWIIKNSWDTWWGEKGYLKIKRGVNKCSIESGYENGAYLAQA